MKRFKIILIMTLAWLSAHAALDYATLNGKALRFFENQEWGSALAMYELMLDRQPRDIPTYYKAIVASGMLGKVDIQLSMLERTQKQGIALDSVFSGVQKVSFAVGEGNAYERFLKLVREHQPWLSRNINIHLLDYYVFRSDTENIIEVVNLLLQGTPDNIEYLTILGNAYSLEGRFDDSMVCFHKVLSLDPTDYNALLTIGNYYNITLKNGIKNGKTPDYLKDMAALAETYLMDAYRLQTTTFVARTLHEIRMVKEQW